MSGMRGQAGPGAVVMMTGRRRCLGLDLLKDNYRGGLKCLCSLLSCSGTSVLALPGAGIRRGKAAFAQCPQLEAGGSKGRCWAILPLSKACG